MNGSTGAEERPEDALAQVRAAAARYASAASDLEAARTALRAAIVRADELRGGQGRNELARAAEPYSRPKVFEVLGASTLITAARAALGDVVDERYYELREGPGGKVRLWVSCRDQDGAHDPSTGFGLGQAIGDALRENGLRWSAPKNGEFPEQVLGVRGEVEADLAVIPARGRRWPRS